jgi:hypothetical protein
MEQIANWLVEFFKRFGTPQPKFFKVLMFVGAVASLLGFAPDILKFLDIPLPGEWKPLIERILKIAGITTIVISRLTSQSPIVKTTPQGIILKATDQNALPFTAEAEKEKAEATIKN